MVQPRSKAVRTQSLFATQWRVGFQVEVYRQASHVRIGSPRLSETRDHTELN